MAKQQRVPHDELHRQAQLAALAGMLRGEDLDDLTAHVALSEVSRWFTPDVAILELAVTALELATPAGTDRLVYEGLRERYLPEVQFRGRNEHRSSQYALYAAAAMRGGVEPDLLNDAGWWQTRLWTYAVVALLIYSRAAAERRRIARPNRAVTPTRVGRTLAVFRWCRCAQPCCLYTSPGLVPHGFCFCGTKFAHVPIKEKIICLNSMEQKDVRRDCGRTARD